MMVYDTAGTRTRRVSRERVARGKFCWRVARVVRRDRLLGFRAGTCPGALGTDLEPFADVRVSPLAARGRARPADPTGSEQLGQQFGQGFRGVSTMARSLSMSESPPLRYPDSPADGPNGFVPTMG